MTLGRIEDLALATGQVSICGNPYHGLVMGDTTLDTGVADPGVITGLLAGPDTHVLAVPGTPAISRSVDQAADDAAHGQVWRDKTLIGRGQERLWYALIGSGGSELVYTGRQYIYGKYMTIAPASWLYADSAGNRWTLRLGTNAGASGYARDFLFTGHLNPRLYARPFGCIGEDSEAENEIDTPTQLTFPSDGGAVVMYPHSYASPIEAYGDFSLSASGYVLRVLDVRAGGSKVLIGCVVTFIINGANFLWIRSLVEATVSGDGDMDPGNLGDGISVSFALLDDVTDCEAHSRNWEIDYLDEYGDPQHYSGDDPSINPGWVGVTFMECDYQADRLIAAWYDSGGDVVRRWVRYDRHGEHTFADDGTDYEVTRVETETLKYLEDATEISALALQVDHYVIGDGRTSATYVDGTETLRLLDYYSDGDDPAREWTYDSTGSPDWVQNGEEYDEWADWKTTFHDEAGSFVCPIWQNITALQMLQAFIGWGPMAEVFLFGHKLSTWSTGAGSLFLRVYQQRYSSSLISGWSVMRSSQEWYDPGSYYNEIAEGWLHQDLCTPVNNYKDDSRKTTTQQDYNLGRIHSTLGSGHMEGGIGGAAYDRYTGDAGWGTSSDPVQGYV